MRARYIFVSLLLLSAALAITLNPATTSASSAGIVFSPTLSSSVGFPIVMHYTNGTFSTTPGTYYCYIRESGGCMTYQLSGNEALLMVFFFSLQLLLAGIYLPATVWASDPTVLQCASFGKMFPTSGIDVGLFQNNGGTLTQIALWTAAYDNSADASTTVTNRYSEVVMSPLFFNFSTSVPVSMTITPLTAFPGLSPSIWYVCVWNVYNLAGETQPGNYFIPENGITNFTVCRTLHTYRFSFFFLFF